MDTLFVDVNRQLLHHKKAEHADPVEILRQFMSLFNEVFPFGKAPVTPEYLDLAGQVTRRELLAAEGGCVSAREAVRLLGGPNGPKDEETPRRAARENRMVGLRDPFGEWLFPVWQFGPDGGLLPGLRDVLDILKERPGFSGITSFVFLLSPRSSLGDQTPLQALREGREAEAIQAAQRYVE